MASSVSVDEQSAADDARVEPRPIPPRRRKLRERVSLGHLFMIAAALLAFVLVVSVLQDRTVTVPVLVADADILPGAAVTPDLVKTVEIPADNALAGSVASLSDLSGQDVRAGTRIAAGDPITLTALAPASTPSGLRAMSLPIDRVDAVGGDLAPGDRVDVIAVVGSTASFIAVDLEVLATQNSATRSGALTSTALSTYYVTVSIDGRTALEVALAMESGAVTVLRSTGAEPVAANDRQLSGSGTDVRPSVGDSTDG